MDVWRITVAALRRWYILLPLLGATALLAMMVGNGVAPEYEARASAMLTPERSLTEGVAPNPYGSITSASEAVSIVLNSVDSRNSVASRGLIGSYEVGTAPRSAILQFTARGEDPDSVVETGNAVFELAAEELSTRQSDAGLPASSQYTLQVLEPPSVISVVQTGKTRIQAVIALVGAAGSLLIAVLFDDIIGLLKRRRRTRRDKHPAEATATTGPQVGVVGDRRPLVRPPESDDAVIHTDQWVWTDENRPIPSGRPRRNPFFDPEFTKRSWTKATANHQRGADRSDQQTGQSADDAEATASRRSAAAHKP